MPQSHPDAIEEDLSPLLLPSKSCPWANQDENIIQMSGGFRYYEGVTGRRCMDGWMLSDYFVSPGGPNSPTHTLHSATVHSSLSLLYKTQRICLSLFAYQDYFFK